MLVVMWSASGGSLSNLSKSRELSWRGVTHAEISRFPRTRVPDLPSIRLLAGGSFSGLVPSRLRETLHRGEFMFTFPRCESPIEEGLSVQVAITCRHGSIPQETHEYITRKSEKLLNYFERVTAIEVTVDFEGDRVKTEINVDAEHKHDFVASVEGEEPGPTFDRALSKMEQQIRKYKEKLTDHRRDPSLAELADPAAAEVDED